MKITKNIFRQLILGKILDDVPISEMFEEKHREKIKQSQKIATEIIEFAEEHKLFKDDIV